MPQVWSQKRHHHVRLLSHHCQIQQKTEIPQRFVGIMVNNGTHYTLDIMYTPYGDLYNPINLSLNHIVFKIIGCLIGIPPNLLVAFNIVRDPKQRKIPRNIFQLAITCSHLTCFLPPIIELIYCGGFPSESMCQIYVALVTVPQALVSANMLLALFDRYLALGHPLIHRSKMTSTLAWSMIIITSILITILIKYDYITQPEALRCQMWLVHVKTIMIVLSIVFVSCIVFNIVIFYQAKKLLDARRTLKLASRGDTRMSIHVDGRLSSRMELEAAQNLMIEVIILCIMPCVAIIFGCLFFGCRFQYGQFECNHFASAEPYIEDISMLPAILSPYVTLIRKRNLRATFKARAVHV